MQALKAHSSELVLVLIMVLLFACARVYLGGTQGCMFVWKGELNFADTVVSLDDMVRLPAKELLAQHRSVYYQLEDMGFLEESDAAELNKLRKKRPKKVSSAETHTVDEPNTAKETPTEENTDAPQH